MQREIGAVATHFTLAIGEVKGIVLKEIRIGGKRYLSVVVAHEVVSGARYGGRAVDKRHVFERKRRIRRGRSHQKGHVGLDGSRSAETQVAVVAGADVLVNLGVGAEGCLVLGFGERKGQAHGVVVSANKAARKQHVGSAELVGGHGFGFVELHILLLREVALDAYVAVNDVGGDGKRAVGAELAGAVGYAAPLAVVVDILLALEVVAVLHHDIVVFESAGGGYHYAEGGVERSGIVDERLVVGSYDGAVAVLGIDGDVVGMHVEKHVYYAAAVVDDALHVGGVAAVAAGRIDAVPVNLVAHAVDAGLGAGRNSERRHHERIAVAAGIRGSRTVVNSFFAAGIVAGIRHSFACRGYLVVGNLGSEHAVVVVVDISVGMHPVALIAYRRSVGLAGLDVEGNRRGGILIHKMVKVVGSVGGIALRGIVGSCERYALEIAYAVAVVGFAGVGLSLVERHGVDFRFGIGIGVGIYGRTAEGALALRRAGVYFYLVYVASIVFGERVGRREVGHHYPAVDFHSRDGGDGEHHVAPLVGNGGIV